MPVEASPRANDERDMTERLSSDDLASVREAEFLQRSLDARARAAAKSRATPGTCSNCGAPCLPTAVYCDEDCRSDHEWITSVRQRDRCSMTPERQAALDARAEFVQQLESSMPMAMRELPQWLFWRFEINPKNPTGKQLKVPYYTSGHKRVGKQGDDADRRRLVSFDAAVKRLKGAMHFDGLGFAFLPGDGLVGVDIDGAIDPDSGEISDLCRLLIESCNSYTERSPSGKGVHIITRGSTKTFKSNHIGLEVFCGAQYFTCSGRWWPGSPREVRPLDDSTLQYMRERVDEANEQARADGAAAPAKTPTTPRSGKPAAAATDDFKRVNDAALAGLDAWVPELFPKARSNATTGGYRVTSKDLGRPLQEDLSITPEGIMDFGEEVGYTAIDLVIRWSSANTPKAALHWLADRIGLPIKKGLRLVSPPPLDPDGGAGTVAGSDDRPEPPPPPSDESTDSAAPRRGRGRKPPTLDEGGRGVIGRLLQHFALLYGTDQVWDGERRATMYVKNLRLLFGAPLVNLWLSHPDRRLLYPDQLVFEPGADLPEGHVNLFDGFAMEPVRCEDSEVQPMLDLAQHLCSLSARTKQGVDEVLHQMMCWLALPLQQPGAKLRFALVFHGPQGTGKNLFFDAVRSVYGKYGRMVGQTELDDKFNGYMSGKLMLIGNEVVTRQELFHNKNKLKWVITEDQIPIRGMHMEVRWESNHANIVFLSNELQPVALEKDDRRHLVVYTPAAEDKDLYLRVADFLKRGGAAKFMHYLQRYDTEGFDEFTKPLMTEAKEALIELGLKPAERFANEWLDGYLPLPLHVCSAEQLYRVFRRWSDLNGEKYPPAQATFTKTVERHVFERVELDPITKAKLPPRLTYKVIQLKFDTGPRKSMRCWLPRGTGPKEGITEGEWAAGAVDSFEAVASRFGRSQQEVEA